MPLVDESVEVQNESSTNEFGREGDGTDEPMEPVRPFRSSGRKGSRASSRSLYSTHTGMQSVRFRAESEFELNVNDLIDKEDPKGKTVSRRFVEGVLQNFKWYFPKGEEAKRDPSAPSLSKAWAYYEHITLARHFTGIQTADYAMERAEPGQVDDPDNGITTELYSPWKTPESALNQWGLGVGSYFTTLRAMAFIMLVVGLINISNIYYYSSFDYSQSRADTSLAKTLWGSTICTDKIWVACSNCNEPDWSEESERFATPADTSLNVTFVKRNLCEGAQLSQGIVNWVSTVVLVILVGLLGKYLQLREVVFDEDKITSTDYSVVVKNPPPDALDPDEWHTFFSQFSEKQVTAVTIALNNDMLVRKLLNRRFYRDRLRKRFLPESFDLDAEDENAVRMEVARIVQEREAEPQGCFGKLLACTIMPILHFFDMFLPPEKLVDKLYTHEEQIKELQKDKYDAVEVFVTFETEAGQRNALTALAASKLDTLMNRTHNVAPNTIFQDRVLKVEEPTEPDAVRWLDLGASYMKKAMIRSINFAVTICMIVVAASIVSKVRRGFGPSISGPVITIMNTSVPLIIKILMIFERHATEGGWQRSLYLKITLFRWVNTAIILILITPFTSKIDSKASDVLPVVNSILWSEMWLSPTLRILDIWGNIQKHILAPRSQTQEDMNSNFHGTKYLLGERYTDLTKVLFVCFFYSAFHPATFFYGFIILMIQYYADKYCLMRIWYLAPLIGKEVSVFSRRYFFSGALLALCITSSFVYAQFPYDNVCDSDASFDPGTYSAVTQKGEEIDVTIEEDKQVQYCSQRFRSVDGFAFPASPDWQRKGLEWMTDEQETLVALYGWTSVAMVVGFVVYIFGGAIKNFFFGIFRGIYKPTGRDQCIDFSTDQEIYAYVPQVRRGGYAFPFLACDVDGISDNLIGWTDTHNSRDFHNIIYDMPYDGMKRQRDEEVTEESSTDEEKKSKKRPIFSIIKHWQPEWAKNEK